MVLRSSRALVIDGCKMRNRPRRLFFWRWPRDGMAWFMWARQNYGSRWIVWRVGPLNYQVEIAGPGECAL